MFLSEYLFDKQLRKRKIEHEWVFPKPNKKYGFDVIVNKYEVEVKEANPSPQKKQSSNKVKPNPPVRNSIRMSVQMQKHGEKEDVAFYAILVRGDFFIIPSFVFGNRMGINMEEGKFRTTFFCYKEAWELFACTITDLKKIYPVY